MLQEIENKLKRRKIQLNSSTTSKVMKKNGLGQDLHSAKVAR